MKTFNNVNDNLSSAPCKMFLFINYIASNLSVLLKYSGQKIVLYKNPFIYF